MRALLCDVLLLSLVSSVSGSCQRDCLTCRKKLRPALGFSLQVCIGECEAKRFPSPPWAPCPEDVASASWQPSASDPALHQPRAPAMRSLRRRPRAGSLFPGQEAAEPGADGAGETQQKQLQKRFGGFTGARKSARKLASQKRFSEFVRQYLVLSRQPGQRRTLRQEGSVWPPRRPQVAG